VQQVKNLLASDIIAEVKHQSHHSGLGHISDADDCAGLASSRSGWCDDSRLGLSPRRCGWARTATSTAQLTSTQGTIRDLNISRGPPGSVPGKKTKNGDFF
jgi:hypothetical protein